MHGALSNQKNKIATLKPPLHPHYDIIFVGELYFSTRRGCPRVLKLCMRSSITKITHIYLPKDSFSGGLEVSFFGEAVVIVIVVILRGLKQSQLPVWTWFEFDNNQ